jgi:hypothetical protein
MALSSTSTLADAEAQYRDNLSWEGDPTRAKNALAAIRFILSARALAKRDPTVYENWHDFTKEKEKLEAYIAVENDENRSTFTRGIALT